MAASWRRRIDSAAPNEGGKGSTQMKHVRLVGAAVAAPAVLVGATTAAAQDFQVIREAHVGNEPGPIVAG